MINMDDKIVLLILIEKTIINLHSKNTLTYVKEKKNLINIDEKQFSKTLISQCQILITKYN